MKTYRRHNCTRKHRTYRTAANCIWKQAEWIQGQGPYALLARCRVLTVSLWEQLEDAQQWKGIIDSTACGGFCHRDHEIVTLADPARMEPWD